MDIKLECIDNFSRMSNFKYFGYIYLAEYVLYKYHIENGISEDVYGCSSENIGTFVNDIIKYYNDHNVRCIIAMSKDKCIGFVAYRNDKENNGFYIVSLYVDKEYRKHGVASKLIKKIIDTTKTTVLTSLIADFNTKSKALFTKLGFKVLRKANIHNMSEYQLRL